MRVRTDDSERMKQEFFEKLCGKRGLVEKKYVVVVDFSDYPRGNQPCTCNDCEHYTAEFEPASEAEAKELVEFVNGICCPDDEIKSLSDEDREVLSRVLGWKVYRPYVKATYWEYQEPEPEPVHYVQAALERLHSLSGDPSESIS